MYKNKQLICNQYVTKLQNWSLGMIHLRVCPNVVLIFVVAIVQRSKSANSNLFIIFRIYLKVSERFSGVVLQDLFITGKDQVLTPGWNPHFLRNACRPLGARTHIALVYHAHTVHQESFYVHTYVTHKGSFTPTTYLTKYQVSQSQKYCRIRQSLQKVSSLQNRTSV